VEVQTLEQSLDICDQAGPLAGYDLLDLVQHQEAVELDETTEAVYQKFRGLPYEFIAAVEGRKLLGLVSRNQIGLLLSGRYGFAVHSRKPIVEQLRPDYLAICRGTPLLEVFTLALSRTGEPFFDDVALVDDAGNYLGIVPVERLVRLQSELITAQFRETEQQRTQLERTNKDLFRSLNELRQSRGQFEILFENSALGVALMNTHGEIKTANRRLETLLKSNTDGEGGELNLTSLVIPAERPAFQRLLHDLEQTVGFEVPRTVEFTLHLPDRGPRLFKFFMSWILQTGQICALLDDITEQRILERRMAQKERTALLESLVGGIAHEINNKLAPVVGYAELLANELQCLQHTGNVAKYCLTIQNSAMESAKIIRQLLQLSRPHNVELQSCDLSIIVREVVEFLRFRLREGGCEVRLEFPDTGSLVLADAGQIKQVVINLVLNAVDAMEHSPQRQLTLRVVAAAEQICLEVTDTGQGIKSEHLGRIFDPFFTTKPPNRGTGLGLSVCFSILQQHGGEITVESVVGHGTTFKVVLRRAEKVPAEVRPDPEAANRLAPAPATQRARVLIVDDEEFITGMIQEALRVKMNCRVDQTSDGKEAIVRLRESAYDLVISDVRMPCLDGFGLYTWIQENQPRLSSRFLFITGDAGSTDLDAQLERLKVPVLRKPFDLEHLIRVCTQQLEG
jgi:two-component system NtrC family sensor kinase